MTFSPRHLLAVLALSAASLAQAQTTNLLNVSYDVAREFYKDLNTAFVANYKKTTGKDIKVDQSHAGSSAQARAVSDGLDADVVTMNTTTDVDFLASTGIVAKDWNKRFANNASPTTSTMLFLTRNGNPKGIKDWDDLVKPGIGVITPNPKTSGGARWNYLAAWEFAKRKYGSEAKAKEFVTKLFANVPVLDSGARGSSVTFAQRNQGDVFISWENEAYFLEKEFGSKVDIVYPSISILTEPPVTVVDKNVDRKGTRKVAEAYLQYLYSDEGQEIAGKNFYRPINEKIKAKYEKVLPKLPLFTIEQAFGGWDKAAKAHFSDGAIYDQIFQSIKR
jgi:sulfate transport system substrate-binding protein